MRIVWVCLLFSAVGSVPANYSKEDCELLARQVAFQQLCPTDVNAVLREMFASLAVQKEKILVLEKASEENVEMKKELEALKAEINKLSQAKQVAFSASLLESGLETIGPFNTVKTMVFKNVVTNIGSAYNSQTGIFVAPVKGVYHFEWYIGVHGGQHHAAASLMKNGNIIFTAWEHQQSHYGTSSNGAALLLEVGDQVYVNQWENSKIFDNSDPHHTTFSGYLLFTM